MADNLYRVQAASPELAGLLRRLKTIYAITGGEVAAGPGKKARAARAPAPARAPARARARAVDLRTRAGAMARGRAVGLAGAPATAARERQAWRVARARVPVAATSHRGGASCGLLRPPVSPPLPLPA
jgi:hypothetical protein